MDKTIKRLKAFPFLALLPPVVALGIQWAFWSSINPFVWFLFYPAVFFSSWIGGLWWGSAATLLSTLIVWWAFLPPDHRPSTYVSMAVFACTGILFSRFHQKLQKAQDLVERSLSVSEDRYKGIFENMTAGFARCRMVFDGSEPVDFIYLEVNPAFSNLTGLKDVAGRKVSEVIPGFREVNAEVLRAYGRVTRTGNPERIETLVESLDIWFSVNAYRPAPGEFIAIFDTITEQKKAELALREMGQRLELATRSGGLGIWDWNLGTGQMLWDSRMMEIYGYSPGDFPGGFAAWEGRLHPEDREAAFTDSQAALQGDRAYHSAFRILLPDGAVRHIEADGVVQRNDAGTAVRMIGLNRDVTEERRASEQQRRMEAELQQAQKLESLGSLASGVAHDMNNVLSAILSIASTMQVKFQKDESLLKSMTTLEHAALRGRDLVKRLTNFVRKDLETPHLIDLNAVVGSEAEILRQTLRQKVALEVDLESAPGWIIGEISTLGSALMNLCVNAVDAMPEGGTLRLKTRRQGDLHIDLIVQDSGQGMSPETLAHATEPFYTTKPAGKGTGLGLAMVHNIVQAHGGELEIQSAPMTGTTITMRFKLAETRPEPEKEPSQADHPKDCPLDILMADDDALVRTTFPLLLRDLGHRVEVVEDGPAALRKLQEGRAYDLVILDHNMPGMTGAQVLDRIKAENPHQPVLVITGFRDGELDQALARWPSAMILIKPLTREEVTRCLEVLSLQAR